MQTSMGACSHFRRDLYRDSFLKQSIALTMSTVKGKTGEKCKASGKYYCEAHNATIITIKAGEIFPKCTYPHNVHDATWILYLQY